jgi:hypothetical protein
MCVAVGLLASVASAQREYPGSCLVFPYYDTTGSAFSIHTITNTGPADEYVRIVFIDGQDCKPRDFWIKLTGKDTFTFMASALLPGPPGTGFLYAYVAEAFGSELEKRADVLTGQEIVFGIWGNPGAPKSLVNFTVNALIFQALDLNPDGKLHLDGSEYTQAPATVLFPRFFGQGGMFQSRMILINFTGGQYFIAYATVMLHNDNEQAFKDQIKFDCHEPMPLLTMSGGTANAFLLGTAHDPAEPVGFAGAVETGTLEITGSYAVNIDGTVTIQPACVYGVLVEGMGALGYCMADLPFHIDDPAYKFAMLWSTDPSGM